METRPYGVVLKNCQRTMEIHSEMSSGALGVVQLISGKITFIKYFIYLFPFSLERIWKSYIRLCNVSHIMIDFFVENIAYYRDESRLYYRYFENVTLLRGYVCRLRYQSLRQPFLKIPNLSMQK